MRYIRAIVSIMFIILVAGCGGTPTKPLPITITAAQVSSVNQIGQTWTFQNGYGDHMVIDVQPGPSNIPGSIIWHYTKDNGRAYWNPTADGAELWFELDPDPANGDGWYCTTFHVIFRGDCRWAYCKGPQGFWVTNVANPGMPRPYLIVPSHGDNQSKVTMQTMFLDFGQQQGWRTDAYVENVDTPVYSGPALVSEQWEGTCVHEKWYFAPDNGLVKVIPLGYTDCTVPEKEQVMVRIK